MFGRKLVAVRFLSNMLQVQLFCQNGTEGVRGIEADGMFKSKWMLQEITKAFNLDVGYFQTRTRRLQAAIFLQIPDYYMSITIVCSSFLSCFGILD